jgi:hypothetical protein
MKWLRSEIIADDPALRRLASVHCHEMVDAMLRRKPFIVWTPSIAGCCLFGIWMIVFGKGTNALEGTRWDIMNWIHARGVVGILLAVLMGYGVAITLGILSSILIRRSLMRRAIRYHVNAPACFWCGYSLVGLPCLSNTNIVPCPECGNNSAIAQGS